MTDDGRDEEQAGEARAKRPPPTIDLEASEVSGDTRSSTAGGGLAWTLWAGLTKLLPALSGALAALAVVAALWAMGLLSREGGSVGIPPSVLDDKVAALEGRVANLESRLASSSAPVSDPKLTARVGALETSAAALRDDLAAARKQADAANAGVSDLKSTPPKPSPSPDLAPLADRVANLEQAVRALPDRAQAAAATAADTRLRRLVVATVLDGKARRGEPYADVLAAAKAIGNTGAALAPLDAFAATGIPTDSALARDLIALLPKLAPPATSTAAPGGNAGFFGRMAAEATKLVHVERIDATGAPSSDPGAVADAARHDDIVRAQTEIAKLPSELRSRAQPWLDAVAARDNARKAAATFVSTALASLGTPGPGD